MNWTRRKGKCLTCCCFSAWDAAPSHPPQCQALHRFKIIWFFYPVLRILLTIINCRLPALVNLRASTAIQLTASKKILELHQVIMDLRGQVPNTKYQVTMDPRGLRLFTMMEATVLTRTLFTNQVVGEFFLMMEIILYKYSIWYKY